MFLADGKLIDDQENNVEANRAQANTPASVDMKGGRP
jgi:hypothetical protein